MNYISAKQFLSLEQKVQDSIIKWWEPQIFDLFFRNFGDNSKAYLQGIYEGCIQDNDTLHSAKNNDTFYPILTESQLRNYIEYKIKDGINIYSSEDGYTLKVETDKGWFVACSEDLLECYLEIAVKVSA